MVSFNGVDLEDISTKIKLLDVIVNPPGISISTNDPAVKDGDIFGRRKWSPRTVDVFFKVMEPRLEVRAAIIDDLIQAAYSEQEKRLEVPQEKDGYLMAVCSSVPRNSGREYSEVLSVSFRASDPFFQSSVEKSAAVGEEFSVLKADGAAWRIVQDIKSPLIRPMWTFGKKQISFSTLKPGKLEINSARKTALLDGQSVIPAMMLGSRFAGLTRGINRVVGQEGAGGTIFYRERWI